MDNLVNDEILENAPSDFFVDIEVAPQLLEDESSLIDTEIDPLAQFGDIDNNFEDLAPVDEEYTNAVSAVLASLDESVDLGPEGVELPELQNITLVTQALDTNLMYKEAELKYYASEHSMKPTDVISGLYQGVMNNTNDMDKKALHALMRSVINLDNNSVFSSGKNYHVIIYEILQGIIAKYASKQVEFMKIQVEYDKHLEAYEQCTIDLENNDLDKDTREALNNKLQASSLRINQIISDNSTLQSVYNSIRSAIPKLETMRKFIESDTKQQSKHSRDVEDHIRELQAELELLKLAKDPPEIDKGTDGDFVMNIPTPAIFARVALPAYENDVRGFRYKCGKCGAFHFTTTIPVYINRIPNYKAGSEKMVNGKVTPVTAQSVVFKPIQCAECQAVNLFAHSAVQLIKAYVLARMNEGSYIGGRQAGTSELNLNHANINAFFDRQNGNPTIVEGVSEVETQVEEVNPLNENIENYISDFKQFVTANRVTGLIQSDIAVRNREYLHILQRMHPINSIAMDEFSTLMSMLSCAEDSLAEVLELGQILYKIRTSIFTLQVANNIKARVGEVVIKDCVISADIAENAFASNKAIGLAIEDIELLKKNEADTIALLNTMANNLLQNLEECNIIPEIIKPFSMRGYTEFINSGAASIVWDVLKVNYEQSMINTIVHIAKANLTSPLLFGGKFKASTPDKSLEKIDALRKQLIREDNVFIPSALDCKTTEGCLHAVIAGVLQLEDSNRFSAITRIPLKLITTSRDKPTFPLSENKVSEQILKDCSGCMGVDYDYSCLLLGKDIEAIAEETYADNVAQEAATVPVEEILVDLYRIGYIFANCVPTSNKGFKAIGNVITTSLIAEQQRDRNRMEELGVV